MTRDMARGSPGQKLGGTELEPGPDVQDRDQALACMRKVGNTEHHPVGTRCMGHGRMAVTDGEGLVHGVTGLRVADGAIQPYIPTAYVNAPIIILAEKIADRIRDKAPLSPQHLT